MKHEKIKKMMKVKAIVTTLLLISFLVVFATGIMLHIKLGIPKDAPVGLKLHIIFGYIMGLLVLVHFIMNFALYVSELRCLFGGPCEMMGGIARDSRK